ncbi:MAG: NUDIX hydrolase [Rhodospirillaceae bacterium]
MTAKRPRRQYAALPYRIEGDAVSILLVTSRDTGRWIIPKGWPEKRTRACDQAAREAFEEAGVLGRVSRKPFGSYRYRKQMEKRAVHCTVDVYYLEVTKELEDWPESHQRCRRWMSPAEAALAVGDSGLADLLLSAVYSRPAVKV